MHFLNPFARRRLFSYVLWLNLGFSILSFTACGNTSRQAVKENSGETVQPSTPADSSTMTAPDDDASSPKRHSRRDMEETEAELERERNENRQLKEENSWLRVQVLELQEALITANQNIYSLNRKLDAIFKPN